VEFTKAELAVLVGQSPLLSRSNLRKLSDGAIQIDVVLGRDRELQHLVAAGSVQFIAVQNSLTLAILRHFVPGSLHFGRQAIASLHAQLRNTWRLVHNRGVENHGLWALGNAVHPLQLKRRTIRAEGQRAGRRAGDLKQLVADLQAIGDVGSLLHRTARFIGAVSGPGDQVNRREPAIRSDFESRLAAIAPCAAKAAASPLPPVTEVGQAVVKKPSVRRHHVIPKRRTWPILGSRVIGGENSRGVPNVVAHSTAFFRAKKSPSYGANRWGREFGGPASAKPVSKSSVKFCVV
jgi:hypothetical protein